MTELSPRNPARMELILDQLRGVWKENPDLRLGQLLFNASGSKLPCPEIFYLEDDALLKGIERMASAIR